MTKALKRHKEKLTSNHLKQHHIFQEMLLQPQLRNLCKDLETTRGKRPMIIDLLKGNNYQPNITEDMKVKEARTHVHTDNNYCFSGLLWRMKKLKDDTYTPLDFNFGSDFCLSQCETIQEEELPCKTVQYEVIDSFSELGIENEPKESEQVIPLVKLSTLKNTFMQVTHRASVSSQAELPLSAKMATPTVSF